MTNSPWPKRSSLLGWTFVLIGLSYAAVIATGAEVTRLAFIMPFLFLGSLLCVGFGLKREDFWLLLGVGLVSGYLLIRGGISPVWDLARRDLFLIVAALLGFLSGSSALRLREGRFMLLVAVSLLIAGNAAVALYQWQVDPDFTFLRSARVSSEGEGVSGFYFHRNYLAGFLEIACPLLFAALLSRRIWLEKLAIGLPLVLGAFVCFLSDSRGGFGAMIIACSIVYVIEHLRQGRGKKFGAWKAAKFAVIMLGLIVGGKYFWDVIVENRGGDDAAEGSLTVRLQLAGMAYDIWLENPLWGMGAESYSYLYPKYFSGVASWLGNAKMAHSDYLQLLTDYGLVGFTGVICLIAGLGYLFVRRISFGDEKLEVEDNGGLWLGAAAAGILVAEALRAAIDFNLHIAPNLTLFAIVMAGGVTCYQGGLSVEGGNKVSWFKTGLLSRALALTLVLVAGGYGLKSGWNEVSATGDWIAVETLRARGEDDGEALRKFSEQAPSFRVLRGVARGSLAESLQVQESTGRREFELPTRDWKRVLERHPLDGEALANYARCLDEIKEFEEAEEYHARALEAVGRRENLYGVVNGLGWHLVSRANDAALERRPGEALFIYRRAEEAFEESMLRGYSARKYNRPALKWVAERVSFLEGARIEPEPVDILDWKSKLL